jgi:excinuclease ABC subunit C
MPPGVLQRKLNHLPQNPGVYLFRNSRDRVIYIGKAKNLRHRIRSYFQSSRTLDHKTEVLKKSISDLDYIITDNEIEALILESTLVKRKKPKFNVHLKDDKSFLHLKLTVNEDFPRVLLTRRTAQDGALYFGPYIPASLARNTIKIINRHFQLRTCDIEIDGELERPCLEYHIKRCLAPCVKGLCSETEYGQAVQDVILLLEGKNAGLVKALSEKMEAASDQEQYEAAAFYRDRISLVRDLAERQKMTLSRLQDIDLFAYHRQGAQLALQLFTLRNGKVVGKREFFWEDLDYFDPGVFLRDAIQQYYLNALFVPTEIHLPVEIEDQELISDWLTSKAQKSHGRKIRIRVPKRGNMHQLIQLVEQNAKIAFETRFRVLKAHKKKLLESVRDELDLPILPKRIEAFDISNIQGDETVASMVVCENGLMSKKDYRKFRIKTVVGPDDFASIFEVVQRRYKRVLEARSTLPDLILIDGGKGQLHFAYQALSKLGIEDIPLASIAKREEHLFVQGQEDPVILSRRSPILQLFQEIRDEAHRFAITYHRKRRSLRDFASELDAVPGIGPKRKKRLLRNFGSVARIGQAEVSELIPFVGRTIAREIKKTLGGQKTKGKRRKEE